MDVDEATLRLLDIMLKDGGLQGLADEASQIMERPIWLMDIGLRYLTDPSHVYPVLYLLNRDYTNAGEMSNDALLYVHQAGHIEALAKEDLYLHHNDRLGTNVLGTVVRIKNVTVAYLFAAELNRPFTDMELSVIRKLRELCALELRHFHDALRINQPAEARLLHELLDQQCRTVDRVLSHGEALGIQFHSHMRMIIIYQGSDHPGMAPWVVVGAPFVQLFSQCLSTIYREQLVLLINRTEELSEYQWLRLHGLLEASGLKAVASRPFSQLAQTFSVYSDTLELMNCCESVRPCETCYRYEENIPLLVAHYLKDKIPLSNLANGALDKLRTYDEQLGQISFETVKQFVECSFNVAKTAEVMYVHKNTMRYRISRAEEIIGLDLSDGKNMFELTLAFAMDALGD